MKRRHIFEEPFFYTVPLQRNVSLTRYEKPFVKAIYEVSAYVFFLRFLSDAQKPVYPWNGLINGWGRVLKMFWNSCARGFETLSNENRFFKNHSLVSLVYDYYLLLFIIY